MFSVASRVGVFFLDHPGLVCSLIEMGWDEGNARIVSDFTSMNWPVKKFCSSYWQNVFLFLKLTDFFKDLCYCMYN